MKKNIIRIITNNAVVAALYFVLTVIGGPFAFGPVQVRIAEVLVLLCFFRRDFTIGVTIGCALANWLAPGALGGWDILIGTIATIIACLGVSFCKHLILSTLFPVITNGLIVGFELYYLYEIGDYGLWGGAGFVALGEIIAVSVLGYALFMILRRNKHFLNLILANRNLEFKW